MPPVRPPVLAGSSARVLASLLTARPPARSPALSPPFAESFLFGMGKNSNTEMSDKVSQRYRLWHDKLVQAMRVSLPPDSPYTVVHAQNLVGLCASCRTPCRAHLRAPG